MALILTLIVYFNLCCRCLNVSGPPVVLLRRLLITPSKSHQELEHFLFNAVAVLMEPVSGGHLRVELLKSGYVHVLRPTMESEQVTNQIKHLIKLQQDKLPKHS